MPRTSIGRIDDETYQRILDLAAEAQPRPAPEPECDEKDFQAAVEKEARRLGPTDPIGDSLVGTEVCRITLVGEPHSKNRPRFYGSGAYTDKKTTAAEESIRTQLLIAGIKPDADHLLAVDLVFRSATGQRRDLDNQVKLVLDACNGFAWKDDFQVVRLTASVERRSGDPGTDLVITRVKRSTGDCEGCGGRIAARKGQQERFCSRECYDEWQRREGETFDCPGCGKPVYQSPSKVTDPGRQPWCRECRGDRQQRKVCKRGHQLTGDNLMVRADGTRLCRTCNTARAASHRKRGSGK